MLSTMTRPALAALVAALLAAPACAREWEYIVNPYLMAPNSSGDFGVGRFDAEINNSAGDVFRNLNFGIMGALEANNGNWGFNLDINYMNVDATDDDVRRLSVNGHQAAYTATVLKRVHENVWLYAGLRLSDMGVKLDCNSVCVAPGVIGTITGQATPDRTRNKSWVEGLVGFRAEGEVSEKLSLSLLADAGGFGEGSDISVTVWPQIGYRIGKTSKALVGYRYIYVDHESGSGADRFVYRAATFGPTVGFEFRF